MLVIGFLGFYIIFSDYLIYQISTNSRPDIYESPNLPVHMETGSDMKMLLKLL